jgi:hypothetical protein
VVIQILGQEPKFCKNFYQRIDRFIKKGYSGLGGCRSSTKFVSRDMVHNKVLVLYTGLKTDYVPAFHIPCMYRCAKALYLK